MGLNVIHVELKEANEFVARLHRHHKPVTGHRFSIGLRKDDVCVGVVIVGRPVARMSDQKMLLEVTRLCTDGTPHACSALYAAAARAGKELGYAGIQTFILETEPGTSLIAAGWRNLGPSSGGDWNRPSRGGRRVDQPLAAKRKYGKVLDPRVDVFGLLEGIGGELLPKARAAMGG
jgi:hypothetical protein